MPDSRYFIVESEDLLALVHQWHSEVLEARARRTAFLDAWGSPEILVGGMNSRVVCGLKDPRQMDPPRPLGKGWQKVRKFPEYVEPTSGETRALLKPIHLPSECTITPVVLRRIAALDPYNDERIFGGCDSARRRDTTQWNGGFDGRMYIYWTGLHHFPSADCWVLSIPDPTLRFDTVDGLREIKSWEYHKLIEEHNNATRAQTAAQATSQSSHPPTPIPKASPKEKGAALVEEG